MSEQTPEQQPEQQPEPEQDGEQLGDGGKAALNAEREARKAADKRAKQFERELERQREVGMSEAEKAVSEAEKRGREAARAEYGERLVRSEFTIAAARRNPDFKAGEVLDDLNLTRFVGEDGEPDVKAIEKAVERLVPTGVAGSLDLGEKQGTPPPKRNDMNRLIRQAVGRA